MATIRSRLETVAACVVACALALGWSAVTRAGTISQSSFNVEIADSMEWFDTREDPYTSLRLSRMTTMEKTVVNSRPYIRITNLTDQVGSAPMDLYHFNLDLTAMSSMVSAVEWTDVPGRATWAWDAPTVSANFYFQDPVLPGDSATMRLTTGPLSTAGDTYTLIQNYFAPLAVSSTEVKYGVLSLSALPAGSTPKYTDGVMSLGNMQQVEYNLISSPIDPYTATTTLVGITIQPVPEPSSLALLAAGGVSAVLGLVRGRRRKRAA